MNHCVLTVSCTDNVNVDPNNITFTIKDTKLYVLAMTLSVKDDQKLSKLFTKEFKEVLYRNEYKTKSENKNTANEHRYFLESNFLEVNRVLVLTYSNADDIAKKV